MKKIALYGALLGLAAAGSAMAEPTADFSALYGDYYLGNSLQEAVVPIFTRADINSDGVYDTFSVKFKVKTTPTDTLFTSPVRTVYWPSVSCSSQANTITNFSVPKFIRKGTSRLTMALELRRVCLDPGGASAAKTFIYSADLSNSPVAVWTKVYPMGLLAFNPNDLNLVVTGMVTAGGTALQPGFDTPVYILNKDTGAEIGQFTAPVLR